MTGLEKIHWAKALIEEKSGGTYQFVVGDVHDDLYLRCGDHANAGLYLTVQKNKKTGNYDCVFKGYTRMSGGYHNAKGIQKLADEYKQAAYLLSHMNTAIPGFMDSGIFYRQKLLSDLPTKMIETLQYDFLYGSNLPNIARLFG